MTRSPAVGRRFRWTREDLYEQCSDHITENTPSSTVFGSRPSSSLTRVNSSGVRLCAAMTSGVIDSIKSRQKAESRRQKEMIAPFRLLLTAYFLVDCRAQFGGLDLAEVLENKFTFPVVKKRCRQRAVPFLVHGMNRGLRIVDVQEHDRHRRLHLFEKIHRPGFVGHFIERDREEIQALRAVIVVDFDQIGKLFAAAIAPRRPKINQQRPRVFRIAQQEFFQAVEINLANLSGVASCTNAVQFIDDDVTGYPGLTWRSACWLLRKHCEAKPKIDGQADQKDG